MKLLNKVILAASIRSTITIARFTRSLGYLIGLG
jgi:hypothetical protein